VFSKPRSAIAAALCVFVLAGCTWDPLGVNDPTKAAADIIDSAIAQLTNQSDQWQTVLQGTIAKLTDETQKTIRNEVQNLLDRTVAVTISNFQCGIVDFLGNRVLEHLNAIKAQILHQTPPAITPHFCQPVPSTLDITLVRSGRPDHADFFGYDFDTQPAIKVFLENLNGVRTDVTSKLITNTAFQLTLPFGANGIQLDSSSKALRLNWNGRDLGSIAVIQPSVPFCVESTVPSDTFGSTTTFIPPHTAGDADFWQGGNVFNGPSPLIVSVIVSDTFNQQTVTATVWMSVFENAGDNTTVVGSRVVPLYNAPLGGKIEGIVSGGDAFSWSTSSPGKVFGDSSMHLTNGPSSVARVVDIGGFSGGPILYPGGSGPDPAHAAGTTAGVLVTWNTLQVKVSQPPPGYTTCT